MTSIWIARAAAAVLGAALLLPAAAVAQAAPAKENAAAATAPQARMLKRVEERIADLHSRLHITAAEEPQWRPFAEQMLAGARQMDEKFVERAEKFRSMNAVQNMQSYAGIAAQHAENTQQLVPLFQTLYEALSPRQKHTADELWRSYAAAHRKKHSKR
jgi:periplasmic protein CpxP/Spy